MVQREGSRSLKEGERRAARAKLTSVVLIFGHPCTLEAARSTAFLCGKAGCSWTGFFTTWQRIWQCLCLGAFFPSLRCLHSDILRKKRLFATHLAASSST